MAYIGQDEIDVLRRLANKPLRHIDANGLELSAIGLLIQKKLAVPLIRDGHTSYSITKIGRQTVEATYRWRWNGER